MSGIDFYVPSTAHGGRNPRLSTPYTDLGVPDTNWIPGVVDSGKDLERLMAIFEPLLLVVQMAGYGLRGIVLTVDDNQHHLGGLSYDVGTSRVILLDQSAVSEAVGEPATGRKAYLLLEPIVTLDDNGNTVDRFVTLSAEGPPSVIGIEADSDPDLRAAFRTPVVTLTEQVINDDLRDGAGLLSTYDMLTWVPAGNYSDAIAAIIHLSEFLDRSGTVDELATDLGDLEPAAAPRDRPYATAVIPQLLADLGVTDPSWSIDLLRVHLVESGRGGDDCSATTFTGALLELHTRHVMDILGPLAMDGGPTDEEIALILDKPAPLDADDLDLLCTYLSTGGGTHNDQAGLRVADEYALTEDPVQQGTIIEALIAVCESVTADPDGVADDSTPPGSFERQLTHIGRIVAHERSRGDAVRIQAFTVDLWNRWSQRLSSGTLAEKFHYGAGILFLAAPDFGVQLNAVQAMALYYQGRVAVRSEGWWRFPEHTSGAYSPPTGWNADVLTALCACLHNIPFELDWERWYDTRDALGAVVGNGIFANAGVARDPVNRRYADLAAAASDTAPYGSAMRDHGDLTASIAARYDTNDVQAADEFAARLRLPKVMWELTNMIESNRDGIADELENLRRQAAEDELAASDNLTSTQTPDPAEAQRQWFLHPATLALIPLLTDAERTEFEERELEILAYVSTGAAAECANASAGQVPIGASKAYLSETDSTKIETAYTDLTALTVDPPPDPLDARKVAGLLKKGVTIPQEVVFKPAFKDFHSSELATITHLDNLGVLGQPWDDAFDDLESWRGRGELTVKLGSNTLGVVAAVAAAYELHENGFDASTTTVSRSVAVLDGTLALPQVGASIVNTVLDGAIANPTAISSIDNLILYSSYVAKLTGYIGMAVAMADIYNAWLEQDLFKVGMGVTGLALSTASILFSSSIAFGSVPFGQVVAVVAFGLGVIVVVYDVWFREPRNWDTLRRFAALWDPEVELELAKAVEVTGIEAIIGDVVSNIDSVAQVVDHDPNTYPPPFGDWQQALARLEIRHDEPSPGDPTTLRSPVPGRVVTHDFVQGITLAADARPLKIAPLCEYVERADLDGRVTVRLVEPGAYVARSEPLLETSVNGLPYFPVVATHAGRVYELAEPDTPFGFGDALCRLRLDDYEVFVTGESEKRP